MNNIEKSFDLYSNYYSKKNKKINSEFYNEIWISFDLRIAFSNYYQKGYLKNTRSLKQLYVIDYVWTAHLERMGYIRETINWRSYGQQNPLIEYNIQGQKSFKLMLEQIRSCMLYYIVSNSLI